jgi:hypothetical protein
VVVADPLPVERGDVDAERRDVQSGLRHGSGKFDAPAQDGR